MIRDKHSITLRQKIYLFVIIAGLIEIFCPLVAHADIFGFEVQDIYVQITQNVKETNEILTNAFEFSQTSPYDVINGLVGTVQGKTLIDIREASKSLALVVAALLLMVDFFRKSVSFEWSSKWENILMFLLKLIVIKQVVQNADTIVAYIYAGFQSVNEKATNSTIDFLPYGTPTSYYISIKQSFFEQVRKGWWDYWQDKGAGNVYNNYYYDISPEAVKMFYPTAVFPADTNLGNNAFPEPTTALQFMPTLEIAFLQPYFLVMKGIAYVIFVIALGRVFELSVYTILAPLPLVTFASETSHDVGKHFIKNYIATVLQITVIVVMFIVYVAINKHIVTLFPGVKLMQLIVLLSLGLGVVKSGAWAKKICGVG